MIIVIIIFLFFFSAGSADPAVWVFKPKGYEHRPRRLSLHPSRGSASQALGGLYTLGSRGCRPTHPRAAAKSAGLPLAPKAGQTTFGVYFLGPWPSAEAGPNALAWQLQRQVYLASRVCTPQARGLQTPSSWDCRPCLAGLHTQARGLQTRSPQGCSQVSGSAPKVGQTSHQVSICQGLGQPQRHVTVAWGNGQVPVACSTPKPSKTFSIVRLYLDSLYIHSTNT